MQVQNNFSSSYFASFNSSFYNNLNSRDFSKVDEFSSSQNSGAGFEINLQNDNKNFQTTQNNFQNNSSQSSAQKDNALSESSTSADKDENLGENSTELTASERTLVRELQVTDTKVKAHEMAHQAAGGGLAGAASYTYERGPDNKMYAVAGEVPISMQKGNTPEETIANTRQIQAAAMAPADPSPQDFKVAASAMRMEFEARSEQVRIRAEESAKRLEENSEENESQNESNAGFEENSGANQNNFAKLQAANNAYANFSDTHDISTTITEQMNFNKAV